MSGPSDQSLTDGEKTVRLLDQSCDKVNELSWTINRMLQQSVSSAEEKKKLESLVTELKEEVETLKATLDGYKSANELLHEEIQKLKESEFTINVMIDQLLKNVDHISSDVDWAKLRLDDNQAPSDF